MILVGQYDSPFVRRVGIALTLYGLAFEHRPWSWVGDADKIRPLSPVGRVPVLVLDDGEALIESHIILDYLDSLVPAGRAMFPRNEPARRSALKVATLAMSVAEKAVSLFYEQRMHEEVSAFWAERCRTQITGALAALEADRRARDGDFWFDGRLGHADIAVAVAFRFLGDAHPGLVAMSDYPALAVHAARLEATPVFQSVSQPLIAPA